MTRPFRGDLPAEFPDELLQEGQDLRVVGAHDVAWRRSFAFQAIAWLEAQHLAILGGDVYEVDKQGVQITGDNWSCTWPGAGAESDWRSYVALAAQEARRYVDEYHRRSGDDYLYSVVVWDEAKYRQYLQAHSKP